MNIRWLASYPKSGNTWARIFLANLLAPQPRSLTLDEITRMPWYTDEKDFMNPAKEFIGKAHHGYTKQRHGTLPAVYIVRDPVDVVPSAAKYFGVTNERMSHDVARDWPRHIRSWWGHVGLVLKYENMPNNFHTLAQFLDVPDDFTSVAIAISRANFKGLQFDEANNGFAEATPNTPFFRRGQPGEGREVLTDAQIARVVKACGEIYPLLGYGGEAGGAGTTETRRLIAKEKAALDESLKEVTDGV